MAYPYDSVSTYNVDGDYDDGPTVPVAAPTHTSATRAFLADAVAGQTTRRSRWVQTPPRSTQTRLGGRDFGYNVAVGYDNVSSYNGGQNATLSPAAALVRSTWTIPNAVDLLTRARWRHGLARAQNFRARTQHLLGMQKDTHISLSDSTDVRAAGKRLLWNSVAAFQTEYRLPWREGFHRSFDARMPWPAASEFMSWTRLRWKPGYPYRSGYTLPIGGEPDLPPGSTITIPSSDAYFMIPALSILRDSDGADLNAIDASLKLDVGSYAWTLDATIPRTALALVDPASNDDPVSVTATVNGYSWRFMIEGYTDNRKFGATGCKIRGRSMSAILGAPYAPLATYTNGSNEDASQLATDLMPTGWTLTWSTEDWLVPAGLFSYADLAPIDALALLVNAIGGIIVPDPMNQVLTIQPMYPTSPWHWGTATPYAEVPASFFVEIDGQWEGNFKTAYNGVYVSGQNSGIVGLVKLTGTDGAILLPTVTDGLLCVQAANVERGRIELAKASKQKTETFRSLLLPPGGDGNPGVFPITSLLKVTEPSAWASSFWLGQTMSIQIDAVHAAQANSSLSVRQTLAVERHG